MALRGVVQVILSFYRDDDKASASELFLTERREITISTFSKIFRPFPEISEDVPMTSEHCRRAPKMFWRLSNIESVRQNFLISSGESFSVIIELYLSHPCEVCFIVVSKYVHLCVRIYEVGIS